MTDVPVFLRPGVRNVVERYDWRLGCIAFRVGWSWWVVAPNGNGFRCASEEEAKNGAQFINLTANEDERQEWRE